MGNNAEQKSSKNKYQIKTIVNLALTHGEIIAISYDNISMMLLVIKTPPIDAKIKLPTFRRRHFEMHFLGWKCMNFAEDYT